MCAAQRAVQMASRPGGGGGRLDQGERRDGSESLVKPSSLGDRLFFCTLWGKAVAQGLLQFARRLGSLDVLPGRKSTVSGTNPQVLSPGRQPWKNPLGSHRISTPMSTT